MLRRVPQILNIALCAIIIFFSSCARQQSLPVSLDLFGDGRPNPGAGTLQDFYKQHYQSFYGAEHMAPDTAAVLGYLTYELSRMEPELPLLPNLHNIGDFTRVSLALVQNKIVSDTALAYAFIASAQPIHHEDGEWLAYWEKIEAEVLKAYPQLANDTLQADLMEAARLNAAVHHSREFHNTYHPHYRIIRNDLVEQLLISGEQKKIKTQKNEE